MLINSFYGSTKIRPLIREAQKLKAQGWDIRDIAEIMGRLPSTINKWVQVRLPKENIYKVVRADYWKVGIYMDAQILQRDFLKPGCFDPQAVLERDGKRFHVRRMANGSQRLECVS